MAEQLKHMFSPDFVNSLGSEIKRHHKLFDSKKFASDILNKEWSNKELKERMHHVTRMMHKHIPEKFEKQIDILSAIAPKFTGFTGTVFPNFIEHFGTNHTNLSMETLKYYTRFSTSEFAVRPFLKKDPELIHLFYKWAEDKNFHVRRLASEGCRPLLPWAMKLDHFVNHPDLILPILEKLKNDKEDYVYRSVANNLNDISKNHPDLVLKLGRQWTGKSETTDWVLKHALRTLLKKGNPEALKIFGFSENKKIELISADLENKSLKIGQATQLKFSLKNTGKEDNARVEYKVHYLKKNGSYTQKVFQVSEKKIKSKELIEFDKKIDFKDLSTRKHYSGTHFVEIIINGISKTKLKLELK
ncbi:MAG: DNA alkylation repair protein [Crocinitomicaceae bacterium]|nr:DNA alkylation repair protein [Crocinitomicaceae bacterium]